MHPQFWFIAHFSKFIPPGSKRLQTTVTGSTKYIGGIRQYGTCTAQDGLEATSFLRPDGQIAIVVLNCGDTWNDFKLQSGAGAVKASIPPHAIQTYFLPQCVPCPANSVGKSVTSGCTCNPGYHGSVTAAPTVPFYNGKCSPVPCPPHSSSLIGKSGGVPGGCTCDAGYLGKIQPAADAPFYTGSCTEVSCPVNSHGPNIPAGCKCNAGCRGSISAKTTFPFYDGECTPVPCPEHSVGANVALGCKCLKGRRGTINATMRFPFYIGHCGSYIS